MDLTKPLAVAFSTGATDSGWSTAWDRFIIRCLFDEILEGTAFFIGSISFSTPLFSGMRKLPSRVELLRRPLEERRLDFDSLEDIEEEDEDTGAG